MRLRPWIGYVPVVTPKRGVDQHQRYLGLPQTMPPEVHQSLEILRLTAVLAELHLLLEAWDSGDVCLREWDQERPCPCARCRGLRIVRYA